MLTNQHEALKEKTYYLRLKTSEVSSTYDL